jgi:nucleoside-diphosphate-sugar epimerase
VEGAVKAVVLTGASGVVGQAILRELSAQGEGGVIALGHRTTLPFDGLEVLRCDLCRPRLGLDARAFAGLARRTGAVIHAAALTEWDQPEARYQTINVEGTARVLELAAEAGAPVYHLSTSYVAALTGDGPGRLRAGNRVAGYIRSKWRCEELVRGSGLPHAIFRPTNLVGDSRTGETSHAQIVQLVSDWICRGRATVFPAHRGNRIDIVPQDVLAKAVVGAVRRGDVGGAHWVTCGQAAMSVEAALEVCVEHAARAGRTIRPPRVVHPDDLSAGDLAQLPPLSRSFVEVLIDVSEVTACGGGVLPSSLPALRRRYGIPPVDDADAYRRTLRFWSATH